jgi:hypothetical protein
MQNLRVPTAQTTILFVLVVLSQERNHRRTMVPVSALIEKAIAE